ncbi:MAG: hypothetical protein ACRDTA_12730 [Pseudonocardiaceae bacterium]
MLTGSSLVGKIESIRYLGGDVRLVHATASVWSPGVSTLRLRRLARQILVDTRTADGGRFVALHNSRV